jgi:hypothetical protein
MADLAINQYGTINQTDAISIAAAAGADASHGPGIV